MARQAGRAGRNFRRVRWSAFDRKKLEERLQTISPRVAYFAKDAASRRGAGGRLDVSKFRDEISAYPAYLGLYFLEQSSAGWVVRISETAKKFLLREEPDVGSFLRLQLPLLQFPNAMGAAYCSFTNRLRIQNNARDHTLELVKQHTHLSPLRLIIEGLKADASLRGVSVENAAVSYGEIYGLANIGNINSHAHPSLEQVVRALDGIRRGRIPVPDRFERRFHLLCHTEMFTLGHGSLTLRKSVNDADRRQLLRQLETISSIGFQFNGFDHCTNGSQIEEVIASGEWGRYFDGVQVLPSNIVEALTNDKALDSARTSSPEATGGIVARQPLHATELYPFRERTDELPEIRPFNRGYELADPEATRIKKQRRNIKHKELIDKMDTWLRRLGARPTENEHIDLFAKIPHDGSFMFEMKSGGESVSSKFGRV